MASSTDASQPLLGDRPVVEQQRSDGDVTKKQSHSNTHILPRWMTGSRVLGKRSYSYSSHQEGVESRQQGDDRHYQYGNYDDDYHEEQPSTVSRLRAKSRSALESKWGHYIVLFMVAIDVACIFADFLIELHTCELRERHQNVDRGWGIAQEALGLIGLIFSCLFMLELIASVLSFGLHFFKSKFHTFDAAVIVLAFILDVALRGLIEELGSLVVVLRLWRVFKIIEEMSEVSNDMMEKYEDELDNLKRENVKLKRRLRGYGANDDEDDDIEAHAGGDEEDNND